MRLWCSNTTYFLDLCETVRKRREWLFGVYSQRAFRPVHSAGFISRGVRSRLSPEVYELVEHAIQSEEKLERAEWYDNVDSLLTSLRSLSLKASEHFGVDTTIARQYALLVRHLYKTRRLSGSEEDAYRKKEREANDRLDAWLDDVGALVLAKKDKDRRVVDDKTLAGANTQAQAEPRPKRQRRGKYDWVKLLEPIVKHHPEYNFSEIARKLNVSVSTISRALSPQKPTGQWYFTAIRAHNRDASNDPTDD